MNKNERQKLFEEVCIHLDYVASLDEEHGGSTTAKRIRDRLIPFCEREGGIKSDAEEWREFTEERQGF